MAELEKFTCTFTGRRKGAVGIMYPIRVEVISTFDRIIPKLYEEYSHITQLKIADSEGRTVNAKLAIEIANWGDD